ncbi:MAG: S8 family serine peptidase [Rhodothalassiaceae bacterium]
MPSGPRCLPLLRLRIGCAGLAVALVLTGCSGGGSSSGGGLAPPPSAAQPAPPPAPTPPPPSETRFRTAEFRRSNGLSRINPEPAYEAGGSGAGVIVGVIDSGIDQDHPELQQAIHPESVDLVFARPERTVEDSDGHGTLVAGVIAAARNDSGGHGVAFASQILAVRTDKVDPCDEDDEECGNLDGRAIADGVRHATRNGARVINLSLGSDGAGFSLLSAVREAAANDVLVVVSAGNDEEAVPDGLARDLVRAAPAHVLIVGATDQSDQIAGFSNRAGEATDNFLVAPGVRIFTTRVGGGFARASGTSFSAPHVAGAAAVLLDLFPDLTAPELSRILRLSARDLGAPGLDTDFGHGLLDLGRAIEPIGDMIVAASASASAGGPSTTASGAAIGGAFGDAVGRSQALRGLLLLDAFRRPYRGDLSGLAARQSAPVSAGLSRRLFQPGAFAQADLVIGAGEAVRLSAFDPDREVRALAHALPQGVVDALAPPRARAQAWAEPMDGLRLGFSRGIGLGLALTEADSAQRLDLIAQDQAALPFSGQAGTRQAGFLHYAASPGLQLSAGVEDVRVEDVGAEAVSATGAPDYQAARQTLAVVRAARKTGPIAVEAGLGLVREDGSLLGSRSAGALDFAQGGRTLFGSVSAHWAAAARLDLFATGHVGQTRATAPGGVFDTVDALISTAFAAGVQWRGLFGQTDRISLGISQPLRIEMGGAGLAVPVDRPFFTDIVVFEQRRLDFEPSGRQLDLELGYRAANLLGFSVQTNVIGQLDAGHVEGRTAYGLLIRATTRF